MAVKTKQKTKKKASKKPEIKVKLNILIPAAAVCVIVAVIISLVIIKTNPHQQELYSFDKEIAQGVDISEHNGEVDWQKLKKEFDFAFIRVGCRGYGTGDIIEDKRARENLEAANKAGMPVGIYFYTQAVTAQEAEKEASFALSIAKHYDVQLPVMIDFEFPCDNKGMRTGRLTDGQFSAAEHSEIINGFLEKVKSKGYTYGVYASSSVLANEIDRKELSKGAVIWTAEYNSSVTYDIDYDIWQYSEKGKTKAVSSKYVDLNYWYTK